MQREMFTSGMFRILIFDFGGDFHLSLGRVDDTDDAEELGRLTIFPNEFKKVLIEDVYLNENWRGNGLGKWMVEVAERFVKERLKGCKVYLYSSELSAVDFWKKLGYQPIPRIKTRTKFGPYDEPVTEYSMWKTI